ncbi:low molecular weight protein-tyrosine-phosphatase [Halomonas nitroreducens]|uniref:protein-tyrosine-phosphatase n=1 Tax=Halomonas nitroreducens TaxID=447425 RepID=A0A3S0I606_9GAMM|nr:low molecular weight protein-tyrosine-phosphatase [Halomonas nitroreducens]RTR00153.1 low molecular weight phosphotyrosine protein phosphatase [Halomonas nitroreducens]
MFERILVVCTGNVCRSPVAEALLRQAYPDRRIESAGLAAPQGREADPAVVTLAEAEGLTLEGHQARQLTVEMLRAADLVLVMTENQRWEVSHLDAASLGKTMLLGRWLEGHQEIPDPHRRSPEVYRQVHQLLVKAVASWQGKL